MPASAAGVSLRCAVFKEEIHAAIVDGQQLDVSFDSFPYYLRYSPGPQCIIILHRILNIRLVYMLYVLFELKDIVFMECILQFLLFMPFT